MCLAACSRLAGAITRWNGAISIMYVRPSQLWLGRRMSLRVLWELAHAGRPLTFRQLQAVAETNPSLLNTRLKELRTAAIVVHHTGGYALSEEGEVLVRLIMPLNEWATEWGVRLGAAESRKS